MNLPGHPHPDDLTGNLSVLQEASGTWGIYLHGVRVLTYTDKESLFMRRVLANDDAARLREKQVKLLPGDNRVLVY